MSEPRVYPSRVDVLPAIGLLWLALSVPVCIVLGVWQLPTDTGSAITYFATAAFLGALLGVVAWPVGYTLEADRLVIRFGVVRVRVPYRDIDEIAPSRTLLAGPALSRDRLLIRHRGGLALISPKDKTGFLRDLAAREPALVVEGEHVRRRA